MVAQTSLDALKSFELRLSKKKFEPVAGQNACLGFLQQLTAVVEESTNGPTRRVALSCVDTIVETFGKKDVDAVISATNTVIGAQCLGAASEEMQITSLLSLSTIVEVLGDEFIAFVPQTLPKALDLLNSKLDDGTCSERLHHAGYSFFSATLIYVPWAITGPNLDLLLRVSHGSANAELGESCSDERRATLSLIAKQIESDDSCAALGRTWANAMTEGPEVKTSKQNLRRPLEDRWLTEYSGTQRTPGGSRNSHRSTPEVCGWPRFGSFCNAAHQGFRPPPHPIQQPDGGQL